MSISNLYDSGLIEPKGTFNGLQITDGRAFNPTNAAPSNEKELANRKYVDGMDIAYRYWVRNNGLLNTAYPNDCPSIDNLTTQVAGYGELNIKTRNTLYQTFCITSGNGEPSINMNLTPKVTDGFISSSQGIATQLYVDNDSSKFSISGKNFNGVTVGTTYVPDEAMYITYNSSGQMPDVHIGDSGAANAATRFYYIRGYNNVVTGRALIVSSTGEIGYASSLISHKSKVQDIDYAKLVYGSQAVTYRRKDLIKDAKGDIVEMKDNPNNPLETGFFAEQVEKVGSSVCLYNKDGTLEGIDYIQYISPLCRIVQMQKATIDSLTTRLVALETAFANHLLNK